MVGFYKKEQTVQYRRHYNEQGENAMGKFETFRQQYPEFVYHGFKVEENDHKIKVRYDFSIVGLSEFHPEWTFPKEEGKNITATDSVVQSLLFSIGLVELVSYWKITCSARVTVKAGILSIEQANWWKKQYFYGLGEFFYKNGIVTDMDSFMTVVSEGKDYFLEKGNYPLEGSLIPIGGGKDSIVTLELLKEDQDKNRCYIINPRGATVKSAETAGVRPDQVVSVTRTLDQNMLELNKQGFLNGHTPFSALVAFSSVLAAYLTGRKYVVLSNESSANESTVAGTDVNHQYSKSFQFEKDFHDYEEKYIGSGVYYFSLLRPWSEFQIAQYFSRLKQYHPIFRSCNAGSKQDIWCGKCSKCLFVFVILSPFLSIEELCRIFGRNLLEDEKMLPILDQLIGLETEKPFECVGSREEINTALCLAVKRLEKEGNELPLLLSHYKQTEMFQRYENRANPYEGYYNQENLVPPAFEPLLRKALHKEEMK